MNDQLQAALAAILSKTTSSIEASVGFLKAELPDVIRQLLLWEMVQSAVACVVAILLFAAVVLSLRVYKRVEREDGSHRFKPTIVFDSEGDVHPGVVPAVFAQVIGIIAAIVLINITWLQILIAPKIYLIEYAARLVR